MTELLVSVRNVDEAKIALAAGVALIDVKEPNHGPLGAAPLETIQAVVRSVQSRVPVSAALGELIDIEVREGVPKVEGLSFVKFGLAGCHDVPNWQRRWRDIATHLPGDMAPVAVVYADWKNARAPHPDSVLKLATEKNSLARVVLVDTFDKQDGALVDHWSNNYLSGFLDRIQQAGLISVVAGSLQLNNMSQVIALRPNYIAVRGAACHGGRGGVVCREKMAAIIALLKNKCYRSFAST